MLKIVKESWPESEKRLTHIYEKLKPSSVLEYKDIVRNAFIALNKGSELLDTDNITEINNGDYQGTLIYLVPFKTYQPSAYEYVMTYASYGSCSYCDALEAIKDDGSPGDKHYNECQIRDLVSLSRDILVNAIRPYNCGWRKTIENGDFDEVEEETNNG